MCLYVCVEMCVEIKEEFVEKQSFFHTVNLLCIFRNVITIKLGEFGALGPIKVFSLGRNV